MAKTAASRKAKGRTFQKQIGKMIADLLGVEFSSKDDALIASRPMGQSGVDIILRGEAAEQFPFAVECKCQESWSVHQWIEQAKYHATKDRPWLLFAKRNRMDPVVIMDAKTFFSLMKDYLENEVMLGPEYYPE